MRSTGSAKSPTPPKNTTKNQPKNDKIAIIYTANEVLTSFRLTDKQMNVEVDGICSEMSRFRKKIWRMGLVGK